VRFLAGELTHLPGPLEHLDQILTVDSVAFRLADVVNHHRTALAAGLASTALLLRFEVE
jgi:hypothetical protein